MDLKKQKLKSRLNLKFQPLHHHRYSVKKNEDVQLKYRKQEKKQEEESVIIKNRSLSHIKLPSLEKSKIQQSQSKKSLSKYDKLDKFEHSNNSVVIQNQLMAMKTESGQGAQGSKGNKIIPKIKIDSKQPINKTITYLLKNQILTVPKIIGLLKKTNSQEFLYLKIVGMYEYQVCEEEEKGRYYATVSKNGMIVNGHLIPLKELVREFDLYKKLKNIHLFKYYSLIRYLGIWKEGSLRARFRQTQKTITKSLYLSDEKYHEWKIQINSFLTDSLKTGGWITSNWVDNYIKYYVKKNKETLMQRLVQICYAMLEKFDLPISANPELMNRVLGNLNSMNINFQKKIMIERQIMKFYKFARQFEMVFMRNTGYFIKDHLESLIKKISQVYLTYKEVILEKLQELDIQDEKFIADREKILINSPAAFDINFSLYLDPELKQLKIKPSPIDIYYENINKIKQFINRVEQINFNLINTQEFAFILDIIFKGTLPSFFADKDETEHIFKTYVHSIPQYKVLHETLRYEFENFEEIYDRRVEMLRPFLKLYYEYDTEPPVIDQPLFNQVKAQQDKIEAVYTFLEKLHDGQYFLFGYLNIEKFKQQLMKMIETYESKFHKGIPKLLKKTAKQISQKFQAHFQNLGSFQNTPESFIIVSEQCQLLEENIPTYSQILQQMQRIQELYATLLNIHQSPKKQHEDTRREQKSTLALKRSLNQIKIQVKDFNRQKDDKFILYRKVLDQKRIRITSDLVHKFGELGDEDEKKNSEIYQVIRVQPHPKQEYLSPKKSSTLLIPKTSSVNIIETPGEDQLIQQQMEKAKVIQAKVESGLSYLKKQEREIEELNSLQNYFTMKLTIIQSLPMHIFLYENLLDIWKIYVRILEIELNSYFKRAKDLTDSKGILKECESYLLKLQKILKDNSSFRYDQLIKYIKNKVYEASANYQFIHQINLDHLRPKDLDEISYMIQRNLEEEADDKSNNDSNTQKKRKPSSVMSEDHANIGRATIRCRELLYHTIKKSNMKRFKIEVSEISFKARKEMEIFQSIEKFEEWFKSLKLQFEPLENYAYIPIFTENYKVRTEIEEYSILLLNILNNKYSKQTRKVCTQLLNKVSNLTSLLQLAITHQQKFLSLYPILTSKYAESQLSSQFKKFDGLLKKSMKNVKLLIRPTQNITASLRSILTNNIKIFDQSQKILEKFLERKRLKFQRFYFLQDDQLLQVLVGISSERQIFRMFDGIRGWVKNEEGIRIGVEGFGGEKLLLKGWVYKNIEPEIIFKSLEDSIKNNLTSLVRNAIYSYQFQLKELKQIYQGMKIPWMCRYAIELILFCKQIELNCLTDHIDYKAIENLLQESINKISIGIKSKKKQNQATISSENSNRIITNSNQITLLLFLLHYTEQIRNQEVTSFFDFQWQSFLRYYYEKDGVKMRALGSEHLWGGQYQGLWSLMVNTSDLRRAHTCVLTNIKFGNGVLLQGPSGTGKTESLKELARCMGKYCVIFNCSNNVKFKTLHKILSGLCYTASWLCLDEINRLSIDIMSVIANQIISIKNAIVSKRESFMFGNKEIKLYPGVGIFSTMNPIYLKRAKLTENIKSYFRVITVTIPDYEKILEIMLYSLQFLEPNLLAEKIGNFFKNLSIQLGEFSQYDFGLRAMKFFVVSMSKYKQMRRQMGILPTQTQIIENALSETFIFRLDPSDISKFKKIALDIFKVDLNVNKINQLSQKIQLIKNSKQTGIIVFGPLSCKTFLINAYLTSLEKPQVVQFNPNAVNSKYFLGESIYGRWQHGVVQKLARQSLQNVQREHIIILDSVIKSQMIESFNTLLDESRILSLSNGTRLKIKENFKMLMETPDLHLSSPATITRCNLIFICQRDVVRKNLIMSQLPRSLRVQKDENLTENQLKNLLVKKRVELLFQNLAINEIREVGQLAYLILSEKILNFSGDWNQNQILGLEKSIIFSARILGLNDKVQDLCTKDNSFSAKKSPFSFILSYKRYSQGEFIELSRDFQIAYLYDELLIKSTEIQFCEWVNRRVLSKPYSNVYWRGSQASGKSTMIELSLMKKHQTRTKISVTPHLGSDNFFKFFESKIHDKNANLEESLIENNKKLILFVEDLYLGKEEVIEQMRFMVEKRKIFDTDDKQIVPLPMSSIFAQGRPNKETKMQLNRLIRHFAKINVPEIDSFVMKSVYQEYIKGALKETQTNSLFKSVAQLQVERLSIFLLEYESLVQEYVKEKSGGVRKVGKYQMIRVLKKISLFCEQNAKQSSDFISIMFYYLRMYEYFEKKDYRYPEALVQAYFKIYKQKYQPEFEKHFKIMPQKDDRQVFTKFSNPNLKAPLKFHKLADLKINAHLLLSNKPLNTTFYLSDSLLDSIIDLILNVIQNDQKRGGLLFGEEGYGKRTLVKLASNVVPNTQAILFKYPKHLQGNASDTKEKKQFIMKFYFNLLKSSFEKKVTSCIIVDFDTEQHCELISFVNSVLARSPVSMLFSSDETDYMFSTISDFMENVYEKSSKTYDEICEDYISLASKRIKCILISSKEQRVKEFENYPYLFKSSIVQYLNEYTLESVHKTTEHILENLLFEKENKEKGQTIANLSNIFLRIYKILQSYYHKSRENDSHNYFYNHLTHFKLIQFFASHYKQSNKRIKIEEDTILRSIQKVHETHDILAKLQEEEKKIEPKIKLKKEELSKILPVLQDKKNKVEEMRRNLAMDKKEAQFLEQQINLKNQEIQNQAQKARPLLNEALQCLTTVKRSEISELKNNNNPHPLVKFTLENLMLVLGEKETEENIKKILSDPNFMLRLKNTQTIGPQFYQKLKKRISQNPEWNMQAVSKVSYGIRYVVKFIQNLVDHLSLHEGISSLSGEIEKMKIHALKVEKKNQIVEGQLSIKEKDLQKEQREYENIKRDLNSLEQTLSKNRQRYVNAQNIGSILFGKIDKWKEQVKYYQEIKKSSEMYNIMMTIFLLVFPYIPEEFQNQITFEIKKLGATLGISFMIELNLIEDAKNFFLEKQIINVLSHQESQDVKKIQFLFHMNKQPLLLDPDNQVHRWLQQFFSSLNKKVLYTKQNFIGSSKTAEQAMKEGLVLVIFIENGQINNFTQEIIDSIKARPGSGKQLVEYNKTTFYLESEFKLILCCKSKTPRVPPSTYLHHQVINFEITAQSLKNRLLLQILKSENESLYKQKLGHETHMLKNVIQLKEMQQKILGALISNKKNIVDDEEFIEVLNKSYKKTEYLKNIQNQQLESLKTVENYMKIFEGVCTEAANIYMSLKLIHKVNHILVWNIQIFTKYFISACQQSISSALISEQQSEFENNLDNGSFMIQNQDFYNYQYHSSRPSSAFSMMSAITSKLASQNMESSREKEQVKQENEVKVSQRAAKLESLLNSQSYRVLDESLRGKMDSIRYSKIITYLLDSIKQAFTEEQRRIWALLLTLKGEKNQNIKVLLSVYNLMKTRKESQQPINLRKLIDQNSVTERIRTYFDSIESQSTDTQARRILADRQHLLLGKYNEHLGFIDILILALILTPRKFVQLAEQVINRKGYATIFEYTQITISSMLKNSESIHPILIIMGQDPLERFTDYFNKHKFKNAVVISMGDGQQMIAEAVLQKEYKKETVVIIHNLHISPEFLPFLTKAVEQFSFTNANRQPHPNFRLILISQSIDLPSQLASSCQKYLMMEPGGIKNRMLSLYTKIVKKSMDPKNDPKLNKIVYSLCLLHCLINQVGNYPPYGLNLKYHFTIEDFIHAVRSVKQMNSQSKFNEENKFPFECNIEQQQLKKCKTDCLSFKALHYSIGEINYLGKIADEMDRKKISVLISRHFSQDFLENKPGSSLWGYRIPQNQNQAYIQISKLPSNNPLLFDLHQHVQHIEQTPKYYLRLIQQIFQQSSSISNSLLGYSSSLQSFNLSKIQDLEPINHKITFIDQEIDVFNKKINHFKNNRDSLNASVFNNLIEQYQLLRSIDAQTKSFSLKSFTSPRKIFSSLRMDLAAKLNVQFEATTIAWSVGVIPNKTQNTYALTGIKLEGGNMNQGVLVDGYEENELILYFWGAQLKKGKEKDAGTGNKCRVKIPLYLKPERSGMINSFGENTNLLVMVTVESKQKQSFWSLRSSAFIACPE